MSDLDKRLQALLTDMGFEDEEQIKVGDYMPLIKQAFIDQIVEQGWYYYNPAGLGEDAFEPLGKKEIREGLK